MALLVHGAHLLLGVAGAAFSAVGLALICNPAHAALGLPALGVAAGAAAGARRISRNRPPFAWALVEQA